MAKVANEVLAWRIVRALSIIPADTPGLYTVRMNAEKLLDQLTDEPEPTTSSSRNR